MPELSHSDIAEPPSAGAALTATEQVAVEHAGIGSVWFQNSVRGAAGLAVAVFIAQRTGLQHGFWVVLGTLSVLRSNALGTGWSILSALAGTAVGIVVGALLVIGIGTHEAVLWAVLPVAILLAAYAPRAISFAAGQAGFTVVLFILFNIIQPVGWSVGRRPRRGRRDRLCDQPRRRSSLLAARCGRRCCATTSLPRTRAAPTTSSPPPAS